MTFFEHFGLTNAGDVATALLMLVMICYAIGDIVSYKTKAIFSMIFVTGFVFLFGFWYGFPKDIFQKTGLMTYAAVGLPIIITHMGTLMKLRDIKQEWKTVIIALVGLVALSVGLFYIAGPFLGREMALTAAGPVSGGIVATIIVSEAAKKVGMEHLAVFATLILVLQNFVGLPIASFCLKSEARRLLAEYRSGGAGGGKKGGDPKSDPEVPTFRLFPALPKAMQTPFVLLAKIAIASWLALLAAQHINGFVIAKGMPYLQIHKFVMALIMGIILYETGFLEHKILDKANAMGYAMFFCLIFIWASLPQATPELVRSLVTPLAVCFGVSVIAIVISTYFTSKLLGYSWPLATAIAVTCLFGFPANFILTNEVVNATSKTDEEKEHCMTWLLPKMLVGGFTTVTIGSVILAGYLAQIIETLAK